MRMQWNTYIFSLLVISQPDMGSKIINCLLSHRLKKKMQRENTTIKIYIFYFAWQAFPSALPSFSASPKINKKRKVRSIIYIKRRQDVKWVNSSICFVVHPAGRTAHPSRHPSIYSNPRSVPSSSRTVFFLGGFVFVVAAVVAQTQHRDKDFLSGFVFVAIAAVAQTQHTEQPLIHPVIRPDCFFWVGLFLWQ
jgi:hypothetical protein